MANSHYSNLLGIYGLFGAYSTGGTSIAGVEQEWNQSQHQILNQQAQEYRTVPTQNHSHNSKPESNLAWLDRRIAEMCVAL